MIVAKSGLHTIFFISTTFCSLGFADISAHRTIIGEPIASGQFTLLREPSGITALDERTLMVVEDEARHALWRLAVSSSDGSTFSFRESEQQPAKGFLERQRVTPLDDLEGIARVSSDTFFIIGSHENASRGLLPDREKILLLTRDGDDVVSTLMRTDLFDRLSEQYPELEELVSGSKKGDKRSLNIEAIAFDRQRQILHIGLRAPLFNKKAIVISLRNAIDYLHGAVPEFSEKLHYLDLNAGGIRAMAYDDLSDSLIIVSKRKRSTMWALDASMTNAATTYESENKELFEDVEGLTPVAKGILFVRDRGNKSKNSGDQWFVLGRFQLGLGD